mgnify:CR=1 FL=1
MIKKIIKILLVLLSLLIFIIFYLSVFGIETEKFNKKIKTEILNINDKINLELKSVKFLLIPSNLSINVKTYKPKINFNEYKLELEYIKTNISLKSFIKNEFSIDDLQISTKAIKLNNIIRFAKSFKNSAELFILNKIVKDGFLVGDINLNFDNSGKIKNDYEIKGFIKEGKLDFFSKDKVKNINLLFTIKDKKYFLEDIEGTFNQLKLSSPAIEIKEKNNQFLINGRLVSSETNNNSKLLNKLLGENFKSFNIKNINFSSDNEFDFTLSKKLKIKDFNLKSIINLQNLDYKNNSSDLKKYLPSFKGLIKLKKHKIFINYKKNQLDINGKGKIIINDKTDSLSYKIIKRKDQYTFDTSININENSFLIEKLQYKKKEDLTSLITLKGRYGKSNEIKFDLISFKENDNSFLIEKLNLNEKFKIIDLDLFNFEYTNNNKIKNQINLKKSKKNYNITGQSFDATHLIDELLNGEETNEDFSIFENLNSNINIEINKVYIDGSTIVDNFSGNIIFIDNKINKLRLDSIFFNKKKLTLTINTDENNHKITTFFSGYPKPLLKRYKFIKGFEEGVLHFYSDEINGISNSVLSIDNFKVQEVPVLAKLLTLASLQGIADLLTGEGIRFTNFEMKFSNKKRLMTIDEMYAIGPAISFLMDGYIENKKLISLRGTLVPATTINRSIASIPLIGNILIGKKAGEGVFGVSFKIKGFPENIKTTVNPIKTLTPRFITRTLEKIKKN